MSPREKWIFAMICAFGLALRLPGLGDSFYGDEGFSLLRDSQSFYTPSEDRFRPIFFSLLYLWRQIGFAGEIGLRTLPLLFGLLQIPAALAVGKNSRDTRTGLWLAALVAASPMLIEFSQELRMYSLAGLIGLVQVWTYLKLRTSCTWFRWVLFVFLGLLGVYTHLHYWLFLAGFAMLWRFDREHLPLRSMAAALGATLILYLPNIQNVINFSIQRGGEYVTHLPSALPKLAAAFLVGYNYFTLPEQGLARRIDLDIVFQNALLGMLALIPILLILVGWIRRQKPASARGADHLFFSLGLFPILLALLAAVVTHKNWLQPKYLISSVPFVLLAIPRAFEEISARWQYWAASAFGVLVLAISWLHFNNDQVYGRREDWRGAAEYLRRNLTPGGKLLITQGTWWLLDYYGHDTRDDWVGDNTEPAERIASEAYAHRLSAALSDAARVYYLRVDTFQNMWDPEDELPKTLDFIGVRGETIQFNPRLKIMQWQRHSP